MNLFKTIWTSALCLTLLATGCGASVSGSEETSGSEQELLTRVWGSANHHFNRSGSLLDTWWVVSGNGRELEVRGEIVEASDRPPIPFGMTLLRDSAQFWVQTLTDWVEPAPGGQCYKDAMWTTCSIPFPTDFSAHTYRFVVERQQWSYQGRLLDENSKVAYWVGNIHPGGSLNQQVLAGPIVTATSANCQDSGFAAEAIPLLDGVKPVSVSPVGASCTQTTALPGGASRTTIF